MEIGESGLVREMDLTDKQFNEVLRLSRLYYREAKKCRNAKAYLAGCSMLGAALEAQLVAIVHCFSDEASRTSTLPKRNGKPKNLLDWKLSELLQVSKELGWPPSKLSLDDEWNSQKARIGDYAEALRQTRNLIHAGFYLRGHSPSRVTARYLGQSFEILDAAVEHLYAKVADSLRKHLEHKKKF